ncbi:hypothetical protein CAPTEDRAFT_18825 [Capitella teleta]|uniref:BEACH domain-containing protein n=1 Tax=Capitella teleta TaxID=283909 RepID=R7TB50_CAPTE|nr:hypothetical protein CAPTEDRAFT_18825 [Capitella teleta]|eukprot:ELT90958.1 hypothetical protein CAPTEDRAFT_18825 [Capitella teleta]
METLLPKLPSTEAPSFFEEFQKYCQQEEWMIFMRRQVIPSSEQYDANIFEKLRVQMTTFMGECHEAMMIASHLRSRERGESKLKFQEELLDSFHKKTKAEERRYQNVRTQLRQQQKYALRQWRSRWAFYSGDRGIWFDGSKPNAPFWKLSSLENSHRMRPKLIPNYNYDPHLEASALRDNIGSENESKDLLSLAFAKEALCRDEDIGDDRLGDEEWNLISAANAQGQEEVKVKLSVDCELVTIMDVTRGQLEVTNTHVYFLDCSPQKLEGQDFKWSLSQLREIHFRRYNLRRSALEFFLVDQSNYFLNFKKQDRNKVYSNILRLRPPNLIYATTRSPTELLKDSDLTRKWLQREISNFEYLMHLNTIAGRTYNDLSQYPVFPWILSNYDSDTLDLDDVSNYRDLSKPIGTINPKTEAEVREKYEHFEDPTGSIPNHAFLDPHGALHNTAYTAAGGKANRQFHSIASTWQSQIENANDVKELVPEFFYLPEFLENINDFDLGRLQNGHERVDDVVLPRWAVSSYDFINKHNRALESEYVSAHLHEWIDLIFGYKQRGPAAAEALNVFYYCTYEGAVDLDSISDPVRRKALEGMINNFGQTPTQLLKDPHPKRMTFDEAITKAGKSDRPLSVFLFLKELATFFVEGAPKEDPVVFICVPKNQVKSFITTVTADSMVVVTQHGVCGIHSWLPYNKSISHFYTFEKDTSMFSRKLQRTLGTLFAPGVSISPWLFAVTHDAKLVLSGGHWDNSLCVYSVPRSKTIASIVRHNNIITCLALDNCGKHLITGSRDATCIIWDVMQDKYGISTGISTQPLQVLCGHDAEVTAVAISIELDMAVSGSKDGTVIIYTVRKGTYMRTLRPPHEKGWRLSVQMLAISEVGHVCVYCQHRSIQNPSQEKLTLHLYSINGKHMSMESIHVPISHMIISGNHLVFGNKQGVLIIKELFGLRTLSSMPLHVPITCLAVTNGNSHILLGLRDGNILIIGIKRQPEVKPIMG